MIDGRTYKFTPDNSQDFEKEYEVYKSFNEKRFDFYYFDYKHKINLYMSIFISSLFFTMAGLFLWLIGIIVEDFRFFTVVLFFGYISIICLFLMKRKRTQFRHRLDDLYDYKFI